jgi:cytochrome c oxidase subunit I
MWEILFSTHRTDIGLLYIIPSVPFLMMGGALAMAPRAELFYLGIQIIPTSSDFHRIFTVHGTNILFLWILPFASGAGSSVLNLKVRYNIL